MPNKMRGIQTTGTKNLTAAHVKALTESRLRIGSFAVGIIFVLVVIGVILCGTKENVDNMVKLILPIATWLIGFAIGRSSK
jgi:hypothetical protein